jgi:uncharacterized membrane protein
MEISAVSNTQIPSGQEVFGHSIRPEILHIIALDCPNFGPEQCLSIPELNAYRIKYLESIWATLKQEQLRTNHSSQNVQVKANLNFDTLDSNLTFGQRLADKVASFGGSWTFILSFFVGIVVWIFVNIWMLASAPFDPYPFILLNLLLSCLAAIQAPIIMMSQNRQESKDRARAQKDLEINLKAEREIKQVNKKMDNLIDFQKTSWQASQQVLFDIMGEIQADIKNLKR